MTDERRAAGLGEPGERAQPDAAPADATPADAAQPDAAQPDAAQPDAAPDDAAAGDTAPDDRRASTRFVGRVTDRVSDFVEGAVSGVVDGASDVVGGAVGVARGAARRWDERPGSRVRRVRRMASQPLPYLNAVHPDAVAASPRETGIKTIDVDQIAGTAVGGVVQRGGDFLPLRPFRSLNWHARWQRIRNAIDRLAVLPPIDVVRFADRYWVLDGHNRVGAALYAGQVGIDANVVELVPSGQQPSERSANLAAVLTGSRALRTAGQGRHVGSVFDEDRIDHPIDRS